MPEEKSNQEKAKQEECELCKIDPSIIEQLKKKAEEKKKENNNKG